jgi:hypothetical protein
MAYKQITLAQLDTYFLEQLGGNATFFRQDERYRILQDSVRTFNCLSGYWRGRVDIGPTVAAQLRYTIPPATSLTYVLRVEWNEKPLAVSSLWDLDYGNPYWERDTGEPAAFAMMGVNQLSLWPRDAAGGNSLIAEGVVPAPLLTGHGYINLGQADLEMILDYATHLAQFKEGGQEFEASQVVFKEFLKEAGQRNAVLMKSARFRKWMGLSDQKKRPMQEPDERVGAR